MKRREAIRNLSLGLGYVVSAPAVLGILESCSTRDEGWEAVFLNQKTQSIVSHLVDIILPSSESPGGLDLDLPRFTDMMCADVLTPEDQDWFRKGGESFAQELEKGSSVEAEQAGRKQVLETFEKYFDLPEEQKQAVKQQQRLGALELNESEKKDFAVYKFLFTVREFSLLGYFTSEKIGKDYLVFDPIPGGYKPCIPLSEVGNAWTIG